jgi:hypothetical protein
MEGMEGREGEEGTPREVGADALWQELSASHWRRATPDLFLKYPDKTYANIHLNIDETLKIPDQL